MSEENKSDLIEYVQNRELKEISGDNGYNDTDAVVFSTLEYLKFEYADITNGDTLGDAINEYLTYAPNKNVYIDPNQKALAEAIKDNPRYYENDEKNAKNDQEKAKWNSCITSCKADISSLQAQQNA